MPYLAANERALRLDVILSSLRLLEKDTAIVVTHPLKRQRLLSQIRVLIDTWQRERAALLA